MKEYFPRPERDSESVENFLNDIQSPYKKEFARTILEKEHLDIYFERRLFLREYKGNVLGTTPDFYIVNTKRPQPRGCYVDLWPEKYLIQTPTRPRYDPKESDKKTMRQQREKYVVLYDQHLRHMEKYHKVDFHLPQTRVHPRGRFVLYESDSNLPKQRK